MNPFVRVALAILFCVTQCLVVPRVTFAQSSEALATVPDELKPWIGWVRARHDDLDCAKTPERIGHSCPQWAGLISLDVTDEGGSFRIEHRVDQDTSVMLPVAPTAWPQHVKIDGVSAPVMSSGAADSPFVELTKGAHVITGTYSWRELPTAMRLPTGTGLIELTVNGKRIRNPTLQNGENLRLGGGTTETTEANQLTLDVSGKIDDGIPLIITTQIDVRASGSAREVDLGAALVPNTELVQITSSIPANFNADNHLILSLRPGTHVVTLVARHIGPASELSAPSLSSPWPEVEYWAVNPNDRIRSANFSGPAGIDPARTTLPEAWNHLTTYQVTPSEPLQIEELRRGEPTPEPNMLSLYREFWLDHDGGGWTIRDHFNGSMNQGWRLNTSPGVSLGSVSSNGKDEVITNSDGDGLELRSSTVRLTAESRINQAQQVFPAVGWSTDVQTLGATIHLPPGYTLLTAFGVDNSSLSLLSKWNLFDLFFVFILSIAIGKLFGVKWFVVALAGLVLARHESGSPAWLWVLLVSTIALSRALKEGGLANLVRLTKWLLVLVLFTVLTVFANTQIKHGLFPQLSEDVYSSYSTPMFATQNFEAAPHAEFEEINEAFEPQSMVQRRAAKPKQDYQRQAVANEGKKKGLNAWIDPNAIVQTGPGIPTWTWSDQPLSWSGPVGMDHEFQLVILGPVSNLLLALLRVALLLTLALRLAELNTFSMPRNLVSTAAAFLACAVAIAPAHAAIPSAELLDELDKRLFDTPARIHSGTTTPSMDIRIVGNQLEIEAEVHAEQVTAWGIPGPTNAWTPSRVEVDGKQTFELARDLKGLLVVRLTPGTHTIRVSGGLGTTTSLPLQFGVPPKSLTWDADGWLLVGQKADGTIDGSIQLIRTTAESTLPGEAGTKETKVVPWLEVQRRLNLGIPWRVETRVTRNGPSTQPLNISIPLIEGEAVNTEGFEVVDGQIKLTLEPGAGAIEWVSTLAETSEIRLEAPTNVPWTERWILSCSPIFSCTPTEGPAPLLHVKNQTWQPEWLVWPGESVVVAVDRPEAISGQTVTIDSAKLKVEPGKRQQVSTLDLSIRTSQGGHQLVTLPPDATLQSVTIAGSKMPLQVIDGRVRLPLKPGKQYIQLTWLNSLTPAVVHRTPAVDLGGAAVNAEVTVSMPEGRWVAALRGPRMGPVPMYWLYLVIVLLAAPLLNRLPFAPLTTPQWLLLGLGMTQVPIIFPLLVVLWFVAIGHRAQHRHRVPWLFNLWQLALLGLTGAAMLALYTAIHAGLLWSPDMQVMGNNSSDYSLIWYIDRVESAMPIATLITFPIWIWRLIMLAWSLWLAARLIEWLPWAWNAFNAGGVFEYNFFKKSPDEKANQGVNTPDSVVEDTANGEPAPE